MRGMIDMKIGQEVKFVKEILNIAKEGTPVGYTVNMFKGEKMIITEIDEYGFVKINNKAISINPVWLV